MLSNHPSATGNQGSIWNYGSAKENEFMGGDKGADTGGTVRYGGNGAYGEWAIEEDADNFEDTDTWNGPTGECCNKCCNTILKHVSLYEYSGTSRYMCTSLTPNAGCIVA